MFRTIGRIFVVIVCVVVILLSVGGIVGAWWANNIVTDVTLKVFSVVQGGVQVVDDAVGRVDTLVQTARSEVQQAGETVTTIAANLQENHPILTALSERVETRLGRDRQNSEAIAPVRDALVTVSSVVSLANSIFVQERAPASNSWNRLSSGWALARCPATKQLREATVAGADKLIQTAHGADRLTSVSMLAGDIQSSVQALIRRRRSASPPATAPVSSVICL
jgi:hypothetical protein